MNSRASSIRPLWICQAGDSGNRIAPSASTTAGITPTQNIARQSPLELKARLTR